MNILLMMGAEGQQGGFGAFIPLLVIIVIFYFFMIRPQMKRQKESRNFRENIAKGDKVLTIGGIYGKVTDTNETQVTLEIADNVRIKVDKTALVKDNREIASKNV